jgi:hypothetical protein
MISKLFISAISMLIAFSFSCSEKNNPTDPGESDPLEIVEDCADWAEIDYGEYFLSNNVWGKENIIDYLQCIELSQNNATYILGWYWDWPDSVSGDVKAYPEIVYGWKPWESNSTTPNLPVQLIENKDITVSWENMSTELNGVGNLAFDIWINSASPPTPSTITREIMIWLENYGQYPGGSFIEQTTIDSVNYDLYKADWSWTYLAFVPTSPNNSNDVHLHLFFNFLVNNNYISSSEYVSSIEFGNEIIHGTGKTTIEKYKIIVE